MIPELPPECFQQILKEVIRIPGRTSGTVTEDDRLLYNCVLVNRTWSRNAVAILWRYPFDLLSKPPASARTRRLHRLMRTYLRCLPRSLVPRVAAKWEGRAEIGAGATFDYLGFLERLHCGYLQQCIQDLFWAYSSCDLDRITMERELLDALCAQVVTSSRAIRGIFLDATTRPISYLRKTSPSLEAVTELYCTSKVRAELIAAVQSACPQVTKLTVVMSHPNDEAGVSSLITSLDKLRSLVLTVTGTQSMSVLKTAIAERSSTLTELDVNWSNESPIPSGCNWQRLCKLRIACSGHNSVEPFLSHPLPKLRELVISSSSVRANDVATLVRKIEGHLTTFVLDTRLGTCQRADALSLLDALKVHAPFLQQLQLHNTYYYAGEMNNELESLTKQSGKLRRVSVR